MNEDNSFEALMNPGEADNFFAIANLPPFDPASFGSYDRTNALWLSEFCRLIYRQENNEIPRPANFITRNQFLTAQGWQEDYFFNQGGTQGGFFVRADRGCGALVFRGTLGLKDDITDADFIPVPWEGGGFVHNGFKDALDDVWTNCVAPRLASINFPIFFTGHSLGAALATLAAARTLESSSATNGRPVAIYTFGSPRVGNPDFGQTLSGLFHCRVVNDKDIVPTVPPRLPVKAITFQHTGQLHRIDANGHLQIFPPDVDADDQDPPAADVVNAITGVKGLLDETRALQLEPPEPLRDHTPVNYTARLEQAS